MGEEHYIAFVFLGKAGDLKFVEIYFVPVFYDGSGGSSVLLVQPLLVGTILA